MPYSGPAISAFQKFIRGDNTILRDHICKEMNELNLERCRCGTARMHMHACAWAPPPPQLCVRVRRQFAAWHHLCVQGRAVAAGGT